MKKKLTPKQLERNALVEKNMGLATHFANHFQASRMEYEDMVQEAYLGLMDAAMLHDPRKGKFSTYARWHILKRIMDAIHNRNEIIRTPKRRPSHICGSLNEGQVAEILDSHPHVSEGIDEAEMVDQVRAAIKQLPSREAIVLRLRYGINTERMTLAKVGDILGVTAERVRQIQVSGEEKLLTLAADNAILNQQEDKNV